jgi:ribonuclease HI
MTTSTGEIIEIAGYLGRATNNVAEYAGLLEALDVYRVKHPNLVPMYQKAKSMLRHFGRFSIRHTLRAGNKDADRLANLAVDRADGRLVARKRVAG